MDFTNKLCIIHFIFAKLGVQYETYLCNLCGNNSHDGYDCQQQFPLVYEQEPSYNQNYNGNYYTHDLPSFTCCDNYGGSHETLHCQPIDQNNDSSGSDQIQTHQYPVIHPPSQEISEEVFQAKGDLMKSIQAFLEKFNCIPFGEKPEILLQAWGNFFASQHAQPEDSNELFQKLIEDLQIINKKLTEYINSPSWDCPTFFNDNKVHSVQYKEYLENPSNEIVVSNHDKEKPPQDSDIRQFIREECCIKVCRKQKQNMEDTMLELVEVCRQKEFYYMHDNVDDLIESALNSKLLSINLESQRLDKKKQEVKNVVEQPTERGTRIAKSFQNFKVIHKNSISLNNTSQIYLVHAIAPVLPTEEPEYSLSMGYEHLSTIPETVSDEVTKSSAKNLLPISSEYEVTSDDENKCDVPIKDESFSVFTTFSNPLFNDNDDFMSSDDESISDEDVPIEEFKVYSNPLFDDEINSNEIYPHYFNVESDFVESLSNRDTLIDSSLKIDFLEEFFGALLPTNIADEERIKREHAEYISIMERLFTINPYPHPIENSNTVVETLTTSPILIEDSDSQREEIDIFTGTDELLPPNDPSFPRPPPEPPDDEFDFEPNSGEVISAVVNNFDELNEDGCFDPGGEIDVFTNLEDDDYFPFIFVI
nr:hypothetical protein [Tanacetum cinerariifolium]